MPMTFLRAALVILLATVIVVSCKGKKKPSMSGEDPVEAKDFIEFFQTVSLPFQVTDSILPKKDKDSLLISQKVFSQFVPDSVMLKNFGKGAKLKIYPLGKVEVPDAETYLFVKAVTSGKRSVLVLAFDKQDKFMAALPLLRSDLSKTMQRTASIDRRYTITKSQLRKNGDGSLSEGKDVYALNADSKDFMLIMTDALDDKVTELINPIDTLPRKHKLSADYATSKMNMVSIRDGRKADRLSFFIHFEKNNGECTGELKGEAIIKSANLAEYKESGDPCVLQFRFTSSSVTLKEIEGCGSRRPLRCSFDGSFPRKKEVKPKTTKSKSAVKK
jgi:hypothetical protein